MSHVLYGSCDSLNACKKRQIVTLDQPLIYPRRPEMEEHFKNVEALTEIIFYYCLLLTSMPHSGPTFKNNR